MKWSLIVVLLVSIQFATAQIVFDLEEPKINEINLKETSDGIFCEVKTNEDSWPIFEWSVNGVKIKESEPLLTSGYSEDDKIRCTVIATNGYLNSTDFREIISAQSSPPAITGAVIGAASEQSIFTWIIAVILGGVILALALINLRLYRKMKS